MPEPKKGDYLCRFNRIDESQLDWGEYFPAQKGKKNSNTVNLFCQKPRALGSPVSVAQSWWKNNSEDSGQRAAVLSSHRASRHLASPSLGQYASLSLVVIGRGQRTGWVY